MGENHSRVKLTLDIRKFKTAGLDLHDTQKEIYQFFMDRGFTFQRHFGYIFERELMHDEWLKIAMELDDKGWFQNFHSFDTDVIGEIHDITESVKGMALGIEEEQKTY